MKGLLKKIKALLDRFNILHDSFEIGILLKGLNGLMETVVGVFLIFITPHRMKMIASFLVDRGLSEDPHDLIASYILKTLRTFSVHTQYFAVFYLLSHGLVKVVMVFFLWRKKLWAYPMAVIVLLCFILIQIYMYIYKPSAWVAALTVFDILLIFLTMNEYENIKSALGKGASKNGAREAK